MELFTEEQRARWDTEMAVKTAIAREAIAAKERRDASGRGMTTAERVRKHRLRAHDAGAIPRVRHRRVREACRYDLIKFGMTYFRAFLNHEPSERMVHELILPLQRMILGGGQSVITFPRSTGKSTWTKIAVVWAILYGHKRFVVLVAAKAELSSGMHAEIIGAFADSKMRELAADFPAVSIPIIACEADPKKVKGVNVNGVNTRMQWKGSRFVFPSVVDESGNNIESSAGAVLVAGSIGGSIKGAVYKNERPDFVILDDPQTRKIAESRALTDKTEKFIDGDVMGLCGQTSAYSAVMSITPILPGDVASRYSDPKRHPEWHVSRAPYCVSWTERAEEMLPLFRQAYADDVASGDFTWKLSTQFYVDNKSAFEGVEVLDPLNFAPGEVDAIHHLLVMRARLTDEAFLAEYQLDVTVETGETALDEETVKGNLTGIPFGILPPGTVSCVAYCDVNTSQHAGLRWSILACGPNGVTAIPAYGSFPEDGTPLVPKGTDPATKRNLIIRGIKTVTANILNLNLRQHGGAAVRPLALCFDGGYEQKTVAETVAWIGENVKLHGMEIMWSIGRNWEYFDKKDRGEGRVLTKDHVRSSVVQDARTGSVKKFLVMQTDYWREIAQKAFRRPYPESGCCALFGREPHVHATFAAEVCYERLVRTWIDEKTKKRAWEWDNVRKGHNHFGDTLVGCFALARWKDIFSALPRRLLNPVRVGSGRKEDWAVAKDDSRMEQAKAAVRRPAVKKPLFRKIKRPGMR